MSENETNKLIESLNGALGWEFRAQLMYAHYAAYVRGIHRLHLKPYFEAESTESVGHANIVRDFTLSVNPATANADCRSVNASCQLEPSFAPVAESST